MVFICIVLLCFVQDLRNMRDPFSFNVGVTGSHSYEKYVSMSIQLVRKDYHSGVILTNFSCVFATNLSVKNSQINKILYNFHVLFN